MKTLPRFRTVAALLALFLPLTPWTGSRTLAQWSDSTGRNTPVCTAPGDQTVPSIAPDGSGGAILAWNDMRGSASAVFAQRLDAAGVARWTTNGVPFRAQPDPQESVQLVTDGRGGAIAVWRDYRSKDTCLYCQRIDAGGTVQWTQAGVPIVPVRSSAIFQAIADGAQGLVVVWEDLRNGNPDIFAQRISPDGVPLWADGGVPVCTDTGTQSGPVLTGDGAGGAVCTWTDSRPGGIYAQRLNGQGVSQWKSGGVGLAFPAPGVSAGSPVLSSDRASGALVICYARFGSGPRMVLALRIDSTGVTRWVDTLDHSSQLPQSDIHSVSSGSVVTTFTVYVHGGFNYYGVVTCIDTSGAVVWQQSPLPDESEILAVASDNAGGVFVLGSVTQTGGPYRFSVQHMSAAGTSVWLSGGVSIDTTTSQMYPSNPVIIADGAGGLIAAWQQNRTGSIDIYAQHVNGDGALPVELNAFAARVLTGDEIQLTWTTMSEVDCYGFEIQRTDPGSGAYRTVPGSFTAGKGTTLMHQSYSFTDVSAPAGTWLYRLKQVDRDGTVRYSEPVQVTSAEVSAPFTLSQNYPNPFNPSTVIRYGLPERSGVTLSLYNALGQRVATLVRETQGPGYHEVKFDGSALASGAYFYRLQAGSLIATKRFLLLR